MKKTFDAVAWMRKRRAEIDAEDEGLSWEERRLKTEKLLEDDPIWRRLREGKSASSAGPRHPDVS